MYTPTSKDLKFRARDVIRRRSGAIVLLAVLFILLQYVVSFLNVRLTGYSTYYESAMKLAMSDTYLEKIQQVATPEDYWALIEELSAAIPPFQMPGTVALLLIFLLVLASNLLGDSYQFHALMESRGVATTWRTLFFAFNRPFKLLVINLLTGLLTGLGTLLFIVPGIVLSLRYSLAVKVSFDNPSFGPVRCMRESARLMGGQKMRLFKLELSFLPWMLLSSLVAAFMLVPALDVWVRPYYNISLSLFYNDLGGPVEPIPVWDPDDGPGDDDDLEL